MANKQFIALETIRLFEYHHNLDSTQFFSYHHPSIKLPWSVGNGWVHKLLLGDFNILNLYQHYGASSLIFLKQRLINE